MGLAILAAIFTLLTGMLMLNFLLPEITTFRADMSCSSVDTITDGTKLLCLLVSGTVPYWILIIFSLAIGGITSRLTLR